MLYNTCKPNMSKVEAVIERSRHANAQPSGVDSDTERDRVREIWTAQPRDALFDTFVGAVCLDIWYTVSAEVQ